MGIETPSHQLYPSPLRYPGGKGKLANFIKLVMIENDLVGSEYVEPYAGGASVALSLLFEDYASHIHINDLNRGIHAFWKSVLDSPRELCSRIESADVSVEEWEQQRDIQRRASSGGLDLAFSTFFLNRTNRSGIIQGGIIGGREQTGKWKIDARWKVEDLVARIQKISRFRSRITVTGLDASEFLASKLGNIKNPFVYLDPPYYGKGRGLYESFYVHEDHARIALEVQGLRVPWIVSYDAVPAIVDLYEQVDCIRYGLRYTARERVEGSEVMFFSPGLLAPDVGRPAGVSLDAVEAALAA